MDRILIILKKENDPRASSAPALGLNTIIFKHVYWYMQQTQVSVYRTIGPLVIFFAQNIAEYVGTRAILKSTHKLCFGAKIKNVHPCILLFYYINVGFNGVYMFS